MKGKNHAAVDVLAEEMKQRHEGQKEKLTSSEQKYDCEMREEAGREREFTGRNPCRSIYSSLLHFECRQEGRTSYSKIAKRKEAEMDAPTGVRSMTQNRAQHSLDAV